MNYDSWRMTSYHGHIQIRNAKEIFIHPKYRQHSGVPIFDIAVIELAKPFIFTDYVRPVCLAGSYGQGYTV